MGFSRESHRSQQNRYISVLIANNYTVCSVKKPQVYVLYLL